MACGASHPQPAVGAGCEVADIFRRHGPAYRATRRVTPAQRKVMRAIESCRTASLGGHKETCAHCGHEHVSYNSCRNRHCPKCQSLAKAKWLEERRSELLPAPYFHCVLTLPHELNALVLSNQRALLNLLFAAASGTLLEFGSNNLGGKVGFTMVLHTWDQQLRAHFHVHCVIPAGALSPDGARWIPGNPRFLFPVRALSEVFRGKFLSGLDQAWTVGELAFSPSSAELATPQGFSCLIDRLRATDWVVYAKRPFAGPGQVLDYLGRYTHRVAISNYRITGVADDSVTFTYRDRRNGGEMRTGTLQPQEFIARFLIHVLPDGFVRIRHFGFLGNRCKGNDLPRCRVALGLPAELPVRPTLTTPERMKALLGIDITRCPACGKGPLIRLALARVAALAPHIAAAASRPAWDTS
jgi:hypothetical protein